MDELQLEAEHSRLKVHKVQAEHEAYVRRSRENYEEKVINVLLISVVIFITDQLSQVCMSVSYDFSVWWSEKKTIAYVSNETDLI